MLQNKFLVREGIMKFPMKVDFGTKDNITW